MTKPEAGWQGDDPKCPKCQNRDCVPVEAKTSASFVVKDSGKRQEFETGARRDTQDGKGDYARVPLGWVRQLAVELQRRNEATDRLDLVPTGELLRLAAVYGKGAQKYGDVNWQRGIPMSRYVSSVQRHMEAYAAGDTTEDHLSQASWNCFAMAWTETAVRDGRLPRELGDYGPLAAPTHRVSETVKLEDEPGSALLNLDLARPGFAVLPAGTLVCFLKEDGEKMALVVMMRAGAMVKGWMSAAKLDRI